MTGPEVVANVPAAGVAAKLNIATITPAAQSRKAKKNRGLNEPVSETFFLCITVFRQVRESALEAGTKLK